MNYFELFQIPVSFRVAKSSIARQYVALQKQYHPDYFGQQDEAAQAQALEMSALVNKAWRTFQQPDETVKYVLQLAGVLEEEEKYQLPPDFLMEVMELNEMKMDDAAPEAIRQRALQLQADIESEVAEWLQAPAADLQNTAALQAVKQWYYQKKYIDRILAE